MHSDSFRIFKTEAFRRAFGWHSKIDLRNDFKTLNAVESHRLAVETNGDQWSAIRIQKEERIF